MRPSPSTNSPRPRLLLRRSELLQRSRQATALADEVSAEREAELIDLANDQWDARVLSHLGEVERRQIEQVAAALRRVADGTYGACVRCAGRIAPARLAAIPEAAMCAACASYVETGRPR